MAHAPSPVEGSFAARPLGFDRWLIATALSSRSTAHAMPTGVVKALWQAAALVSTMTVMTLLLKSWRTCRLHGWRSACLIRAVNTYLKACRASVYITVPVA